MDSFAFNQYLKAAREHGQHDYQKYREFKPEQYEFFHLRHAYKSGYESARADNDVARTDLMKSTTAFDDQFISAE